MRGLRVRIKDKRICGLVKAFLKSGIFTELGDREESMSGTPQGGILSPLLANIALSALDEHFDRQRRQYMGNDRQRAKRRKHGQGNWKLIRYADDFVLMVSGDRHHAEALREEVAAQHHGLKDFRAAMMTLTCGFSWCRRAVVCSWRGLLVGVWVSSPRPSQEPLCFLICLTSLMQAGHGSPAAGTPAGTVVVRAAGLRVHGGGTVDGGGCGAVGGRAGGVLPPGGDRPGRGPQGRQRAGGRRGCRISCGWASWSATSATG